MADFQASDRTKARAAELLRREKTNGLTAEEKAELDYFEMLEEIMGLAKARARQIVAHGDGD